MTDLQKAEQELKEARHEVRNLTVMAMRPDLLPSKVELIKRMERSARVEVKLRLMHLRWLKRESQRD
jgi:hypothetical protein